jgi:hypothetical protein
LTNSGRHWKAKGRGCRNEQVAGGEVG